MNKTPKLRFKEFTGEWESKKLEALGQSIIGLTYSPDDVVDNGTLVLRSSNIKNSKIVYTDNVFVNMEIQEKIMTKENDVLICSRNGSRGLIGKSALIDKSSENNAFGAFMTIFRSEQGKFIFQVLQSAKFFKQIHQNLGATINQITSKDLNSMQFYVPSIDEQDKIASFLLLIDKKISLQDEKVEVLKDYKKGMMQKIFSRELRFKDDDGRDYPEWEEKKLGELIYEPPKIKEVEPQKQELLTVKLHCLGIEATGKYPNSTQNGRPYYKRFKGELLIGRQNMHNGGMGIVDDKCNGLIASNAISSYISKEDVSIKFIYYTISRVDYYKRIDLLIGGTGQKEISKKELENLVINTPCLEEQKKIVEFLNKVDIKLEKEQAKLDSLNEYKKGLLQQMFV